MYLSVGSVLEVRVWFFASIVCWLLEPEVGVALGQTGLLRCAAARFSLAGLHHSGVLLWEQMVALRCVSMDLGGRAER